MTLEELSCVRPLEDLSVVAQELEIGSKLVVGSQLRQGDRNLPQHYVSPGLGSLMFIASATKVLDNVILSFSWATVGNSGSQPYPASGLA